MGEASIELADDAELLELMYRANFRSVFIEKVDGGTEKNKRTSSQREL